MMRIASFHDRSLTSLARAVILAVPALLLALVMTPLVAAEKPAGGAPDLMSQAPEQVAVKNANCVSCHTQTDSATMHEAEVPLACVDCHGGDISARDKEHAPTLNASSN